MSSITIRRAVAADVPQLTHLWHEKILLQQQSDRRLTLLPDAPVRWAAQAQQWLLDTRCALFVAEREDRLIGYLVAWVQNVPPGLSPENVGAVTEIAIDAHSHEGGLGRLLLEAARDWLAGLGITHLIAYVPHRWAVEQAFWRSQPVTEWMDVLWMKL